jgi:hypothetical protein
MRIHEGKESAHSVTWRHLCGIDLRSLALFRASLALVVLVDVVTRARDLTAHYTDAGVLSRSDLLATFSWLHALPLCVHLISGAFWGQAGLFAAHALFAIAMLVGYRTGVATFVVWLLTMSVQLRNLYIGGGWDAQMRMLLFWSLFLPLGARYSVDAVQRGRTDDLEQPYVSVGTVALLAQIVIIYLSSGYAKALERPWIDGTAVQLTLADEFWVTGFGLFLLRFPWLCRCLTYGVLGLELFGPVALFVPLYFGPVRTATVAAFFCMHLGFHLGMHVGLFPWTSAVALTSLLPGWFWAHLPASLSARGSAAMSAGTKFLAEVLPAPAVRGDAAPVGVLRAWQAARPGRLADVLCAIFLAYVVFWNIGVVKDPAYDAPAWIGWLGNTFFLQQDWRMFARASTRTGWIVIPGTLKDGTEIDLFSAGGPAPRAYRAADPIASDRPHGRAHDQRWLNFANKLAFGKRGQEQLLLYGRYLCKTWNAAHTGGQQLERFEIVFMARPVTIEHPRTPAQYTREVLWRHWCFGAPPALS